MGSKLKVGGGSRVGEVGAGTVAGNCLCCG